MTDRSIDMREFIDTLSQWSLGQRFYYIKRPNIVEKIEYGGRTFYAHFERVDEELSPELISRQQSDEITLAVPVSMDGETQNLFFIYDGESTEVFIHLFKHLMSTQGISSFQVYRHHDPRKITACIRLPRQTVADMHIYGKDISRILEKNITKNWKILPDPSLPDSYNIVTIPYIN